LNKVWVQTVADGLVRADHVVGVTAHRTPAIGGKPSRWLLDVVLPTTTGSGSGGSWIASPLHRTLAQTDHYQAHASEALARLLAELDALDAAGIISVDRDDHSTQTVRLQFTPFPATTTPHHITSTGEQPAPEPGSGA
jgi:hypothetical protein